MSARVSVALCDHQCRPEIRLDYERLNKELCRADCIESLQVAPVMCRQKPDLPPGCGHLLVAACPAALPTVDPDGSEPEPHPVLTDTRTEVFDLYREPGAVQDNLRRKLLSLSLVMAAAGDATAAPVSERPQSGSPVLVVGDGFTGALTALRLSSTGVPVELATVRGAFFSPGSYHVSLSTPGLREKLSTGLRELTSWPLPADCRAVSTEDGVTIGSAAGEHRSYKSIVLVPELVETGSRESGALTLSECYARIAADDGGLRGTTCFLLDRDTPADPVTFSDVLHAAVHIVRKSRGSVVVLTRDAQVTGTGGQRLYDAARTAGVLFVRYGDDLTVSDEYGDFVFSGADAQSGVPFAIELPQTVVVPGPPGMPPWALSLLDSLDLNQEPSSYIRDDSLWFLPNETGRAAVYAAGPGRRRMDSDEVIRDAVSAALTAVGLLHDGHAGATAVVAEASCSRCLTCIRSCPFGAVRKGGGRKAAVVQPADCRGCGICVSVCPARAVELRDQDTGTVAESMGVYEGLLVLHCAEGAGRAVRRMIATGRSLPPDVGLYEMPCSGRVEESLLLHVLEKDIRSILVVGCHRNTCRFLDGNRRSETRIRRLKRILNDAGIGNVSVDMVFAAPDEGVRVHNSILEAHRRMDRTGGVPWSR